MISICPYKIAFADGLLENKIVENKFHTKCKAIGSSRNRQ